MKLRSVLLQKPCPSLTHSRSLGMVPRDPFQMSLHLGRPLAYRIAQPHPTLALWGSFPLPISAFPQPPGQGLAYLPAYSCLEWLSWCLRAPQAWLACPGVARCGVWLCWCSLELLPSSFLLEGWLPWQSFGTGFQVSLEQRLRPHCARCHAVGIFFVLTFKA